MVSPGTHFMKSHESQSKIIESQSKNRCCYQDIFVGIPLFFRSEITSGPFITADNIALLT